MYYVSMPIWQILAEPDTISSRCRKYTWIGCTIKRRSLSIATDTLTVVMDTLQYGTVDGEDEPGRLARGEVTHGHLVEPAGGPRVGAEEDDAALDLRSEEERQRER